MRLERPQFARFRDFPGVAFPSAQNTQCTIMRMLFCSTAGLGSLHPLIALAREAKVAGHEVAIATSEVQRSLIERLDFRFFPAGPNPRAEMLRRHPDVSVPPVDDESMKQVRQLFFGGVLVELMLPALLDACRSWLPDIVVRGHLALAPCIAAEELGIPHATIEEAAAGELASHEAMWAEPLARWRRERGLSADPELASLRRYLWLVPFPPSLRHEAAPLGQTACRTQPLIFNESQALPTLGWLEALPGGPLVHVSLGSFAQRPELLRIIVDGLAEEPYSVVLGTTTSEVTEAIGTLPPNVIAVPFVPHSLLLPRCDAFITHAGAGGLITGIMTGLPMVFVPLFGDQPPNAICAAKAGTGIVLDPATLTAESVRDAIRAVLGEPRYRQSVQRVKDEANALPDHKQAVRWLEYVAEHRATPPAAR
jgi:MGT family glycosyltransferase